MRRDCQESGLEIAIERTTLDELFDLRSRIIARIGIFCPNWVDFYLSA